MELLTMSETAQLLKICKKTLRQHIKDGLLPAPIAVGKRIRFDRAGLESYLKGGKP